MQGASLTGGNVLWIFNADTGQFSQALVQAEGQVRRTASTMDSEAKRADKSFNALAVGGIAAVTAAAVAAGVAITRSIGSAVRRVDTLNNFPKVLSAMGVSASAAATATSTLSERLIGLPTTLQDGASAIQGFIAAGLPVAAATEGFLALNNALLAGGTSAQAAAAATYQLREALGRGRIDAREWMSIIAGAPTFLQAMALETGKTRAELRDLYATNPDQLISDLIRLNKEGGGGLASLEEQARAATGGIGTAIINLGNRLTQGIGEIIQAFSATDIAQSINDISTAIKDGLVWVANFVRENRQLIGTLVGAAGGFIAAAVALRVLNGVLVGGWAIIRGVRTAWISLQTVMITMRTATSLAAAGHVGLAGSMLVARAAAIKLIASLTLIGTAMAVIGFIAGEAFGQVEDVDSATSDAAGSAEQLAKWMKDAESSTGGASEEASKLAKQLRKIDEQINRSNRDYRESLAEIVARTRQSIENTEKQLSAESDAYRKASEDRLYDYEQAQADEAKAHADKVKRLTTQINFLSRYNNQYNRQQLTETQFALARENYEYTKAFNERQTKYEQDQAYATQQYELRRKELQASLDNERNLLNKHRKDVDSIRNVILLDEIQKLKRSQEENLASLRQQRQDAIDANASAGSAAASAFSKNFFDGLDQEFSSSKATSRGMTWGESFSRGMLSSKPTSAIAKYGPFALFGGGTLWTWDSIEKRFEGLSGNFSGGGGGGGGGGGRYLGGPVSAGVPYLVGENRDGSINDTTELFIPRQSGTIVSSKDLQSALGSSSGTSNSNVFNINLTGTFATSKTEQRKVANQIAAILGEQQKARGLA